MFIMYLIHLIILIILLSQLQGHLFKENVPLKSQIGISQKPLMRWWDVVCSKISGSRDITLHQGLSLVVIFWLILVSIVYYSIPRFVWPTCGAVPYYIVTSLVLCRDSYRVAVLLPWSSHPVTSIVSSPENKQQQF